MPRFKELIRRKSLISDGFILFINNPGYRKLVFLFIIVYPAIALVNNAVSLKMLLVDNLQS